VKTTLADFVTHHADARPDHPALRIEETTLTYAQLAEQTDLIARALADRGVQAGDTVALLLPNCVEFVVAWLALGRLGAAAAAINTSLRAEDAAAAAGLAGARIAVVDTAACGEAVAALARRGGIDRLITRDHDPSHFGPGPLVETWAEMRPTDAEMPTTQVRASDPSILLFTSGSTGIPKACVLPHRYTTRQAQIFVAQLGLTDSDILFCPFPLFHADAAIFTVAPALVLGATAALVESFTVRGFWDQVRHYGATVFDFMGATLTMLDRQPPSAGDADNPARLGWGVPLPTWASSFERRFGVELVEVYGLSDAGIVLYNNPGQPRRAGSCGRPVAPFDVRVLDSEGFECPPGVPGELCIRPNEPDVMMTGYFAMPEATAAAFRNLWFHTGDIMHRDEDGYFYFHRRGSEMIRRRGENIPAPSIEQAALLHPAVVEAAAFGVPSELTEEDIMLVATVANGHRLEAPELHAFCAQHLPPRMVPRYIDMADGLPRTPTEKIAKHLLKERGPTLSTYDAQSGGPASSQPPAVHDAGNETN
jgi:carnitine-CoA ligase